MVRKYHYTGDAEWMRPAAAGSIEHIVVVAVFEVKSSSTLVKTSCRLDKE